MRIFQGSFYLLCETMFELYGVGEAAKLWTALGMTNLMS
jgi:hypothetical protein